MTLDESWFCRVRVVGGRGDLTHLGVRSLRLSNGAVQCCTSSESSAQALVDPAQFLREDPDVVLQTVLLIFLLFDLSSQLLSLRAQLLDT